jgi:UDP-glucose 4-epimerase
MNTVVTGGAGFIGSHLVDLLLKDGHAVTVIDNFSTGRRENLAHIKNTPHFSIAEADIRKDIGRLNKILKGVDWVFHLAALADIVPSINHPTQYHSVNVTGTVHMLEASRMNKVKKFIYAASSSCYGIAKQKPTSETAPVNPQYPYALTKYAGECCVLAWGRVYKLPVISLRLFNVYGPRSRTSGTYGAVIGTFLAQKLAGKPLTIVGNGKQTRDFTYVSDIAGAFLAAAQSPVTGEIFNVGSGGTYSIQTLAKLIGGPITYIPKRPGEPDCTFADITKIKKVLQWNAVVSFEEGMTIVLNNIDYWRNAPVWTPRTIQKAMRDWFTYLKDT